MAMTKEDLGEVVGRYRRDPESVYNTWFVRSPERLKAFRSIRRGVAEVVKAIRAGTFGNDFKGSPLESVLWLGRGSGRVVCAFEVEKSTSIYSGILRLVDLAKSVGDPSMHFYLVAPDAREREILAQLRRPAFGDLGSMELRYILFRELCEHCDGLCKFGDDHTIMRKIAKGKDGAATTHRA